MKLKYLLILLLCLIVTACSKEHVPTNKNPIFTPDLDVVVSISGNDATVRVDTNMEIASEQYGEARKIGEGHIHMYLDNGEKIGVKHEVKEFKDLAPGIHKLKVSLHNNDHTPYDVTKTVEFEIK
jgi:hypothetical protein